MESGAKILVIDDEKKICQSVEKILSKNNFEVTKALSAKEALDRMANESFELLISDIIMPETSGIDAAREILSNDPDAVIVMCSALGQKALVDDALKAGARDFLVKPFNPSKVMEVVETVLNLSGHSRGGK